MLKVLPSLLKDGEYYFAFNGEDGNTYLRSEGYTNEQQR